MKMLTRRQVMLDQQVQGALITRVILYWITCQLTTALLYGIWCQGLEPTDEPARSVGSAVLSLLPALLGSLLVLPLVLADVLRLSQRFVAPVWNLRNALKRLELGDAVSPLELRRGDYWHDLLGRFNQLLPRLQPAPPSRSLAHETLAAVDPS